MTIQMEMDLRRLDTLPALCRKAEWVGGLTNEDLSTSTDLAELSRLNLQYTSLRDLISSAHTKRGSPKGNEVEWCDMSQVKFKDRLLKQAARAYLQPMAVKTNREVHFLARCWTMLTSNLQFPIEACIGFFTIHVYSKLSQAFDLLVQKLKPQLFGILPIRATQ